MEDYLNPLLQKEPEYIMLHVETKDCQSETSDSVLHNILILKSHVESVMVTYWFVQSTQKYDS